MAENEKIIEEMGTRWQSNIVPRKKVKDFSGGVLSSKTMANEDCNGTGPEGRFLLMNQIVYPVENLVAWLKTRTAKSWQTRKAA
jgi:hypothetical protein